MTSLYRRLLRRFGPQGWWPVTPRGAVTPRYHPGRFPRLGEREKLEIAAGAILTQNTAWTNVTRALENLHRARALTVGSLVRTSNRRLERLIRPSGYFSQKAVKLKAFAKHLARTYGGRFGLWLKGPLDQVRGELLDIHGVGPETADSILLYAGARPVFVVDAYTRRIGRRLGFLRTDDYEQVRRRFEKRLPRSVRVYQEMHALLVELAKRHCTKRDPDCPDCPLRAVCRHGRRAAPLRSAPRASSSPALLHQQAPLPLKMGERGRFRLPGAALRRGRPTP